MDARKIRSASIALTHFICHISICRPDLFKVINSKTHVLDDGRIFPFRSSTDLHPEWPVAALDHVNKDVSREVQEALLSLNEHALSIDHQRNLRCDTTPELAELALQAKTIGLFTEFRTPRSYFGVRTKQHYAGFLHQDSHGDWTCAHSENLYDGIDCPVGHYKVTEEEFNRACDTIGLPCKEGYECYCQPCIKNFEVDVHQHFEGTVFGSNSTGCDKMSMCGTAEQTKEIVLRAIDNVKRDDAEVEVLIHFDRDTENLDVYKVPGMPFEYEFRWSRKTVGVGIMEVFVNGEQIPESPFRVQVLERQCDLDFPGQGKVSTGDGSCKCSDGSIDFGRNCVSSAVFAATASIGAFLVVCVVAVFAMRYYNRKHDEMWQIDLDELHFDDPVEVIGQGSFGVVLLAEYRGTNVAIKRALKSKTKNGSKRGSRRGSQSKMKNIGTDSGSVGVISMSDDGVNSA